MLRNYFFHLMVKIFVLLKLLFHFRVIFIILPTPHYYPLLFFILNYNTKCAKCQLLPYYLISFLKQSICISNARTKIVVQSFTLNELHKNDNLLLQHIFSFLILKKHYQQSSHKPPVNS